MADIDLDMQAIKQQQILRNIAEDIKWPLLRIIADVQARKLSNTANTECIETTAEAAIKLLDSFIFSTQVYNGQKTLQLEPVSVAAIMQDTAQYLYRYASQNNCELQIVSKRKSLAMANITALQAALVGLAYSFISASRGKKEIITFAVEKNIDRINAGIFNKNIVINAQDLQLARQLTGKARQLLPNFSHVSSAGILIADTLFSAMNAPLSASRMHGLTADLMPSRQLALL